MNSSLRTIVVPRLIGSESAAVDVLEKLGLPARRSEAAETISP